eukprot:CAMPEP_0172322670 /NCGR_PEP_ID=MMETSP1058-20130122/46545_1 /TAXON_ID=83371 /ORGANISM="Detonula confervacea, Strain CCMP 353" /LENGTH=123 /DNA_ID=CAMNT_0013038477 /DNA_START=330 /DNA_END=701 /DNA_ORIENTATION=+
MSAAADLTPQGRAILEAASKFGDGKTLPFTPCKKYYNPFSENGTPMYACRLHSDLRMKRLKKEGGKWRGGEKHLDDFWKDKKERKNDEVQEKVKGSNEKEINDGCTQEKKLKQDHRKEKSVGG